MAHPEQQQFFSSVKAKYPTKFENCSVLDVGSMDINGNNRFLFHNFTYIGLDIGPGRNVDVICPAHEYQTEEQFDVIISSECLEHDKYYRETLTKCVELTKSGGLFTFSCASTGRAEHGTSRTDAGSSPYTTDYYKNLTEEDIRDVLDLDALFAEYEIRYQPNDLYFYGIKR